LYVYNVELDGVREVFLTPCSSWGGEGSLGCGIGYGYLHRIPVRDEKKSSGSDVSAMSDPNMSLASNLSTMVNVGSQLSLLNSVNSSSLMMMPQNMSYESLTQMSQVSLMTPSRPSFTVNTPPSQANFDAGAVAGESESGAPAHKVTFASTFAPSSSSQTETQIETTPALFSIGDSDISSQEEIRRGDDAGGGDQVKMPFDVNQNFSVISHATETGGLENNPSSLQS
jgi:hypothetical protein